MKVFVGVIPKMSIAMERIAWALKRYAPKELVTIVPDPKQADLQVLHAIGPNAREQLVAPRHAVIQYCVWSNPGDPIWQNNWDGAELVWSYYDLAPYVRVPFYYSPLGVDKVFRLPEPQRIRDIGVVTSGYVHGAAAEAIEEVADAALEAGLTVVHVGPDRIVGMGNRVEKSWTATVDEITDEELVDLYSRAGWVSGLRHMEGFELPVIEGAACGATPIVFDRPEMRKWFDPFAQFLPEEDGEPLRKKLVDLFKKDPPGPAGFDRSNFSWELIVKGFWDALSGGRHGCLRSGVTENAED